MSKPDWRDKAKKTVEDAKDKAEDVSAKRPDFMKKAEKKAKEVAGEAKEKAEDVAAKRPDFMKKTEDKVKAAASDAKSKAEEVAAKRPDFMKKAEAKVEKAVEDVKGTLSAAKPDFMEKGKSEEAAEAPPLATHTVVSGDTLSGIALKYYGSATRDKWMTIYEANKETIGDNPSLIRVGQELVIPKLEA